jgi:hypothetical protein
MSKQHFLFEAESVARTPPAGGVTTHMTVRKDGRQVQGIAVAGK